MQAQLSSLQTTPAPVTSPDPVTVPTDIKPIVDPDTGEEMTFDMSAYTPKTNTLPTTNVPGYDMSNQMYDIPAQFKR